MGSGCFRGGWNTSVSCHTGRNVSECIDRGWSMSGRGQRMWGDVRAASWVVAVRQGGTGRVEMHQRGRDVRDAC